MTAVKRPKRLPPHRARRSDPGAAEHTPSRLAVLGGWIDALEQPGLPVWRVGLVSLACLAVFPACAASPAAGNHVATEMRTALTAIAVEWNASHQSNPPATEDLGELRTALLASPALLASEVIRNSSGQTLDVAYHRRIEHGGIAQDVDVLRMCVTYRLPARDVDLSVTGTACKPSLPDHVDGLGTVTRVVDFNAE